MLSSYLLLQLLKITACNRIPIDFLLFVCRISRIKQLLECGVDIDSSDGAVTGNHVIHWAASYGNLETVKFILGM